MTVAKLKGNTWTSILLVVVNVILLNLIFREFGGVRVDVTEGSIYSLSDVTDRILANLDEPVTMRVYMSRPDKLPETLRPFVPEIENLLDEYAERADGMIEVIRVVPEEDADAEEEAQSRYGVEANPFIYQTERQQGVGSYYLSIVVQYAASSHTTIGPSDLITQNLFDPEGKLELKNVEFALTRAIKKSITGFEDKRDLFEKFPHQAKITTYITEKDSLPELFKETPERVDKVLSELAADSGGKLVYEKRTVKPDEHEAVAAATGIPPLMFTRDTEFYLWADIEIDGKSYRPLPLMSADGAFGEFDLKSIFVEIFKRMTPGVLRTVGVAQHAPPPNPMAPMQQQQQPGPFEALAAYLGSEYEVRRLELGTLTRVPPEVDVLVVLEPEDLEEKAVYAIDQFVMRGGKAVFCVDRTKTELRNYGDLSQSTKKTGLEDLLGSWGVALSEEPVFDKLCDQFPWTRSRPSAMGMNRRRPAFVDFLWPAMPLLGYDEESVNRDVQFLASFEVATMWFPSEVTVIPVDGITSTWLLRSSDEAWMQSESDGMLPDVVSHEKYGYALPPADRMGRHDLAVMLEGRFKSWYADRPIPVDDEPASEEAADGETDGEETAGAKDETGPTAPLDVSPDTRIVVFGDADWVRNLQRNIPPPYGDFDDNARVVKHTVAWLLEDDDLAGIRGRGRTHRPLRRLEEGEQATFRTWNVLIPLLTLAAFGVALFAVRKNRRPLIQEEAA